MCRLYPVEVGYRNYVSRYLVRFLADIGAPPRIRKVMFRRLQETRESRVLLVLEEPTCVRAILTNILLSETPWWDFLKGG